MVIKANDDGIVNPGWYGSFGRDPELAAQLSTLSGKNTKSII
jgi:hypothetical protein